jgi:hypothetical protein
MLAYSEPRYGLISNVRMLERGGTPLRQDILWTDRCDCQNNQCVVSSPPKENRGAGASRALGLGSLTAANRSAEPEVKSRRLNSFGPNSTDRKMCVCGLRVRRLPWIGKLQHLEEWGKMNETIRLVCATRQPDPDSFFSKTSLGRSMAYRYSKQPSVSISLYLNNKKGLPWAYNSAIDGEGNSEQILVFLHDDLQLIDFFWADELRVALDHFDVVGLAGNRRRTTRQPSWAFVDERMRWDKAENLSGHVRHGEGCLARVSRYGPTPQRCLLMDGVFLAVRRRVLRQRGLRFDERFQFHFYDLDFCRRAEQLGVSMGTWPISVIHQSGGDFGSARWRSGLAAYFQKWRE